MFGTLQVAFKHRAAMFDGRSPGVAFVALPNILIFQFLFTLISPIIDLMLLSSVVSGVASYSMHPLQPVPSSLTTVATFWIFFQTIELLTSAVALKLARQRGIWRLLPLLIVQRFCYRQLLYIAAVRVAVTAIKGNIVGWGKLARTGSVQPALFVPRLTSKRAEPAPFGRPSRHPLRLHAPRRCSQRSAA